MAWYDTGTVAVTNGSTTVTGTGTDFISGAQVGEAFLAPDDKLYEIASITSATVLVLADAYLGSTQSGQEYKIVPTQSLVADLAGQVTDLITDYSDVKDGAGAGKFNDGTVTSPAITFEQDQNNGLYRIGNDNYGLSAGGTKQIDISTTDVELNHSGSKKLATTSTGVDVTGTVTADGLDVDGSVTVNSSLPNLYFTETDTSNLNTRFALQGGVQYLASVNDALSTTKNRISWDNNTGDISFYEDTGTTAKMVWDASAESLGIGTSGFSSALSVATNGGSWTASSSDGVGINYNSGNANISTFLDNSTLKIGAGVTQKNGITIYGQTGGNRLQFDVAGSERARIDASGNLLVGKTSLDVNVVGHQFLSDASGDYGAHTSQDTRALLLNRKGADGEIASFRKDGSPVGSIGSAGPDLTIGCNTNKSIVFEGANSTGVTKIAVSNTEGNEAFRPYNSDSDAVFDLGRNDRRFKDLYLSGGVYLGGTGAVNKLDDYEEGTWTPTVGTSGGGQSVTYGGTREGRYVKVGGLVHLDMVVSWSSFSGGSGVTRIFGVPYSVGSSRAVGCSGYVSGINITNSLTANSSSGLVSFDLREMPTGTGSSSSVSPSQIASSGELQLSITYYTNQ